MVLSFAARRARGDSRQSLMKHAARRSALILLIGYAIRILPYVDFSHMRYPGVLQRIAIVYLFASVITLWTATRGRILWIAGLLAGYYAVMRFVPVPGCDHAAWMTQHCSLAGFIDHKLMLGHLYRRDFDPEGLLSTFPAIATTLLGTLAGEFLRSSASLRQKLRGLLIAGVAGVAAGYAWHLSFPISKPLWTSSYVLFTAGAACLLLAFCWWLIDMRGWRAWSGRSYGWDRTPFWLTRSPPSSPSWDRLSKYLTAATPSKSRPGFITIGSSRWRNQKTHRWPSPSATWRCGLCVAWALYRKKIFVKV